ncbi:MAG: hypothetical protein WAV09_01830 [Minisyncoccia bacterium]
MTQFIVEQTEGFVAHPLDDILILLGEGTEILSFCDWNDILPVKMECADGKVNHQSVLVTHRVRHFKPHLVVGKGFSSKILQYKNISVNCRGCRLPNLHKNEGIVGKLAIPVGDEVGTYLNV